MSPLPSTSTASNAVRSSLSSVDSAAGSESSSTSRDNSGWDSVRAQLRGARRDQAECSVRARARRSDASVPILATTDATSPRMADAAVGAPAASPSVRLW